MPILGQIMSWTNDHLGHNQNHIFWGCLGHYLCTRSQLFWIRWLWPFLAHSWTRQHFFLLATLNRFIKQHSSNWKTGAACRLIGEKMITMFPICMIGSCVVDLRPGMWIKWYWFRTVRCWRDNFCTKNSGNVATQTWKNLGYPWIVSRVKLGTCSWIIATMEQIPQKNQTNWFLMPAMSSNFWDFVMCYLCCTMTKNSSTQSKEPLRLPISQTWKLLCRFCRIWWILDLCWTPTIKTTRMVQNAQKWSPQVAICYARSRILEPFAQKWLPKTSNCYRGKTVTLCKEIAASSAWCSPRQNLAKTNKLDSLLPPILIRLIADVEMQRNALAICLRPFFAAFTILPWKMQLWCSKWESNFSSRSVEKQHWRWRHWTFQKGWNFLNFIENWKESLKKVLVKKMPVRYFVNSWRGQIWKFNPRILFSTRYWSCRNLTFQLIGWLRFGRLVVLLISQHSAIPKCYTTCGCLSPSLSHLERSQLSWRSTSFAASHGAHSVKSQVMQAWNNSWSAVMFVLFNAHCSARDCPLEAAMTKRSTFVSTEQMTQAAEAFWKAWAQNLVLRLTQIQWERIFKWCFPGNFMCGSLQMSWNLNRLSL